MSRIRIAQPLQIRNHTEAKWFEQMSPATLYERDFESKVIVHAPSVYPDYFVVPFKRTLSGYIDEEEATRKPDLVFVARDYLDWYIVEIELCDHGDAHINAQVSVFSSASLEESDLDSLVKSQPALDRAKLANLCSSTPQGVLVIGNAPFSKETVRGLTKFNARVAVFQFYRSDDDIEIFRVDGTYPSAVIQSVSTCRVHSHAGDHLIVDDPVSVGLKRGSSIKLLYENCWTQWDYEEESGTILLKIRGRSFMVQNAPYRIVLLRNGARVLEAIDQQ